MLTKKQYQLLVFIDKKLNESGVSPSFEEMKEALDLRSKSGIHRLITGLEERGFIRRLPHRARALEVLRLPENMDTGQTAPRTAPAPAPAPTNVIPGRFGSGPVGLSGGGDVGRPGETVSLPLYGRSPPARRSRPCAIIPTQSTCRPPCSAAANTTRWRSTAIP